MSRGGVPEPVMDALRRRDGTTRIAVVGASNDPSKYGNIIVRNLHDKGYTVLPVNPREREIAGLKAYATVADVPPPVHVVDFVTPPAVTLKVLSALDPASAGVVWLQDGSYDDAVVSAAESRFEIVVHHACIMVVTNYA